MKSRIVSDAAPSVVLLLRRIVSDALLALCCCCGTQPLLWLLAVLSSKAFLDLKTCSGALMC